MLGYPTVSMTSSWVITASANPPRASFVNYPLGHTAGRPEQLAEQIEIATAALSLIETASESGKIEALPHQWPTQWRAKARELSDTRTERHDTPQFERADDEAALLQGG